MNNKRVFLHVLVLVGLGVYLVLFYATRLKSLENVAGREIRPGERVVTIREKAPLMVERDRHVVLAKDTELLVERVNGDWAAVTVMEGGQEIRGWVHREYLGNVLRRVYFLTFLLLPDELVAQWCGTPPQFAVLDRVPVLAVAGVILGSAAVVGWLLMLLCRADRGLTRLETFLFSTAAGLNIVSTYVLLVGLLGLVRNVFLFAIPAVLTLGAAGSIWLRGCGFLRSDKKRRQPGKQRSSPAKAKAPDRADDWLSPQWLWLAAPLVVAILLGGMLPPVEFDVREYHLQVPKESFQQGYVGFLPHNVYGNMPMGTEMLSLLAMVVAGDWWLGALAGKTLIAAFAPLTALGLYAAGRRFFSPGVGVAAAVVYLSIPWIAQVSCLGLVEGASACYLLLAVYAVLLWQQKGVRNLFSADEARGSQPPCEKRFLTPFSPFLLLAGYLAGGAVSCKYPAVLFVVAPLAVWILLSRPKEKGTQKGERPPLSASRKEDRVDGSPAKKARLSPFFACGVFLVAAAVGCGAWFGKNWAFTGNPTYPLLYGVFGDKTNTWTPVKNQQWNRVHRPQDFSPQVFAKDMARVGLTSEWLSPLVMPLAALAFLVPTRRRLLLALAAYFAYVILMWWLLTHRLDRFWIAALPLVSLLAGVGACWSRDVIWRRVLVGLLVFGALAGFLTVTSVAGGDTRYFVRLDRLRGDPMRLDEWHRYFNTHARDGRVLLVGEAQVFDLEVPIVYSTCFDDTMFERLAKGRTAEQVRSGLAREGISHVYVHWGEIVDRYRKPGNYGFTDFVQPAVFDRLVAEGVLEPLPTIEDHRGRAYRVVPGSQ